MRQRPELDAAATPTSSVPGAPRVDPALDGFALAVGALLLVAAVALYAPILTSFFTADDFAYLDAIQQAGGPAVIFSALAGRYFRPAVVLVYYLNYQSAGLTAWPYHLSVVVIHAAAAWMVFLLGRRLWPGPRPWPAALAALLFVSFAGHSEAVTWIGGMADPLVTLFVLLALELSLRALDEPHRPAWLAVSWAAFACALLSKESAVVYVPLALGAAVLLRPNWPDRRERRRLAVALGVPVLLVFALIASRAAVLGFAGIRLEGMATNADPLTMTRAFVLRTVLPPGRLVLALFRYRLDGYVLLPLVLLVAVLTTAGRRRALAFAAFAFVCTIAPVLPLSISLHDTQSERLIYMASAFSCLFVVAWLDAVIRWPALTVLVLAASVANAAMLQVSNRNWRDAARIVEGTMRTFGDVIRQHGRPGVPVIVANVPDNIRGAYTFRRGFHEALRVVNPGQLAQMAATGVLAVHAIEDPAARTTVRVTGPRTMTVEAARPLLGTPAPDTTFVALRQWSGRRFDAIFTPAADGALIVFFTPFETAVIGRLPFDGPDSLATSISSTSER